MAILKKKTKADQKKILKELEEEEESEKVEKDLEKSTEQTPAIVNYHYQILLQSERLIKVLEIQNEVLKGIGQNLVEIGKVLDEKLEIA